VKKILCVVGTRPEVIKMAPVIKYLQHDAVFDIRLASTSQHRQMLDQMLATFDLVPDIDLDLMKEGQTLPQLTARLPVPLDDLLGYEKPDLVLAQGDTTTVCMVGLACFYRHTPLGHIEAGLRSGNFYYPFPEEMNRVLVSRLASLHFAPTEEAKSNLLKEGYQAERIIVTGNTVIDALYAILKKNLPLDPRIDTSKRLILVTAHRRENFGDNLNAICESIRQIVERHSDVRVLYPVHPNPHVLHTVHKLLGNIPSVILSEPLDYPSFVTAMKHAYLILSDSGGVQEEAPALGVPVLVLREQTERPEGVLIGVARIVGTNPKTILHWVDRLLNDDEVYRQMVLKKGSPYGDGKASQRIAEAIQTFLGSQELSSCLSASCLPTGVDGLARPVVG
jgi:UDP-N-acetylglucosamine 2-epimerase (non-hydrolysing)